MSVDESMVILAPMSTSGAASASATVTRLELGPRPAPERPAARGEQDPAHLVAARRRAGLVDRRVLGVDRARSRRRRVRAPWPPPGPPAMRLSLLASARRLPCSSAASVAGRPAKPTTALSTTSASGSAASSASTSGVVGAERAPGRGRRRTRPPAREQLVVAARGERDDLVLGRGGRDDVERLGADRPGRAEDSDDASVRPASADLELRRPGSRRPAGRTGWRRSGRARRRGPGGAAEVLDPRSRLIIDSHEVAERRHDRDDETEREAVAELAVPRRERRADDHAEHDRRRPSRRPGPPRSCSARRRATCGCGRTASRRSSRRCRSRPRRSRRRG